MTLVTGRGKTTFPRRQCKHCRTDLLEIPVEKNAFRKIGALLVCPYCDSPSSVFQEQLRIPQINDSHKSLRCGYCDTAWPIMEDFLMCPLCREQTEPSTSAAMPVREADGRLHQHRFGWWLYDSGSL